MKRETAWILVELGGGWPPFLTELTGSLARRVIAQAEGEDPAAFAARVAESLARAPKSARPRAAIVVCNERVDAAQTDARRRLARALLAGTPGSARKKLVFAAAPESERLRPALERLSAELDAGLPRRERAELRLDARVATVA